VKDQFCSYPVGPIIILSTLFLPATPDLLPAHPLLMHNVKIALWVF